VVKNQKNPLRRELMLQLEVVLSAAWMSCSTFLILNSELTESASMNSDLSMFSAVDVSEVISNQTAAAHGIYRNQVMRTLRLNNHKQRDQTRSSTVFFSLSRPPTRRMIGSILNNCLLQIAKGTNA
jgi:hypothetical protein